MKNLFNCLSCQYNNTEISPHYTEPRHSGLKKKNFSSVLPKKLKLATFNQKYSIHTIQHEQCTQPSPGRKMVLLSTENCQINPRTDADVVIGLCLVVVTHSERYCRCLLSKWPLNYRWMLSRFVGYVSTLFLL